MSTQDVESGRLAESVLRCIDSLWAQNAKEYRQIRRAEKKAKNDPIQDDARTSCPVKKRAVRPQKPQSARLPQHIIAQLDALNRKLAAANLKICLYQTRVFACERVIYALQQENAELIELCRQVRQGRSLPPEPQKPVLDKPGFQVSRFTPQGERLADAGRINAKKEPKGRPSRPGTRTKSKPLPEPQSPLEHLSAQLLAQFDRMIGT